jgi:hypothetical protein
VDAAASDKEQRDCHCADTVLDDEGKVTVAPSEARDAATAFLGGTV